MLLTLRPSGQEQILHGRDHNANDHSGGVKGDSCYIFYYKAFSNEAEALLSVSKIVLHHQELVISLTIMQEFSRDACCSLFCS